MSENMHHIELVDLDENGKVQGGMDFWHVPGAHIYLYQVWEYRAAGNEYKQALPDPIMSDPAGKMGALEYTVRQCWLRQVDMVFKNPVYPVDTDYR